MIVDGRSSPPLVKMPLRRHTSTFVGSVIDVAEQKTSYPLQNRKTKIVCTIGPISQSVEALSRLMQAGMSVARMNFSHGDHPFHTKTIENVRAASKATGIPCALLLDTKGPEIRTGKLVGGEPIMLQRDTPITIHCAPGADFLGTASDISVDYANMPQYLSPGDIVKIDDGVIQVKVDKIEGQKVIGTVLNTQELGQTKGCNLPGVETDLPAVTEKDIKDIRFGVAQKVDFLAPSFINRANDIRQIREILGDDGAYIQIISKIESQEGLEKFDEILEVSDGIMVARGDLGVEVPIQKVCLAQKTMIQKCRAAAKPVITATQMLDSMIKNPRPTHAEVSDVANAVLDGSDCVMLSGESAKGQFGTEAVSTMARISRAAERSMDKHAVFVSSMNNRRVGGAAAPPTDLRTEAVTSAAVKLSLELEVALVIALTDSGRTARFVSKYRPDVPVLTVTPNGVTARQALVFNGLWPLLHKEDLDDASRYELALSVAKENKWVQAGDSVVLVSGKQGVSGSAHQLSVLTVEG